MELGQSVIERLRQMPPFQDVSDTELESLLPDFRSHRYRAGEFVWRQGDPADELWFVLEGQVHSVHGSPDGAEVVTQVAAVGDSFGQPALFAPDATRIVSIVADMPTHLLSLAREPLVRFLERHPPALRRMLESMSLLILSQSNLFGQVAFLDVRARVVYQLEQLAEEYGEPVEGGRAIPFRLSQSVLAGMVAASRESVNRALTVLEAEGRIRQEAGRILVVSR